MLKEKADSYSRPGDVEGVGGGDAGNGDGDATPPDKEPDDPCGNMGNKSSNGEFNTATDTLDGLTDADAEAGMSWTYDDGDYDFFGHIGNENAVSMNGNPNPIDGFMHTHLNGHMKSFSYLDLWGIIQLYLEGKMRNPGSFTLGVITSSGTYFITITDLGKFDDFANYINRLVGAGAPLDQIFRALYGTDVKDNDSLSKTERDLLNALDNMDAGLTLMKELPNGNYGKPGVDSNGTVTTIPC